MPSVVSIISRHEHSIEQNLMTIYLSSIYATVKVRVCLMFIMVSLHYD